MPLQLPPPTTCRNVYGTGTCSEFDFCSGHGNCTYGLCACLPGYLGINCANFISCKYWDVVNETWSSEGLTTIYEEGNVFCETTHLTDFGGIIVPNVCRRLMKELAAAFSFNVFTLDEMMSALANSFGDNLTIMIFIITLVSLDLISPCLGWFRGHVRQLRRREDRMYDKEVILLEVMEMERRKKQLLKAAAQEQMAQKAEEKQYTRSAWGKQKMTPGMHSASGVFESDKLEHWRRRRHRRRRRRH